MSPAVTFELKQADSSLYDMVDFDAEYGPAKSSTVDDQPKLQQALNETPDGTVLKLSAGSYYVGSPLIAKTGTRLKGPSIIRAKTGFDFSATVLDAVGGAHPVAILMSSNGGFVYSMGRLYLDDITVNGNNIANSRGILAAVQQPAEWYKWRVEHCLDYGVKLKGQDMWTSNGQLSLCGTGIVLDNVQFLKFFGFNAERCTTGILSSSGNNANIIFPGAHFENNTMDFDFQAGDSFIFEGTRHSTSDGQTSFNLVSEGGLVVVQGRNSVATNTGTAINHPTFGALRWWDAFRGHLNWVQEGTPSSFSYTDPWRWTWSSGDGKLVRFGGRFAANIAIRPAPTNPKDLITFEDIAGTRQSRVTSTGELEYVVATKGVILLDRTNGNRYRLKVTNGVFGVEAL